MTLNYEMKTLYSNQSSKKSEKKSKNIKTAFTAKVDEQNICQTNQNLINCENKPLKLENSMEITKASNINHNQNTNGLNDTERRPDDSDAEEYWNEIVQLLQKEDENQRPL